MKKQCFPKMRYVAFFLFCALAVQSYNVPVLYVEQQVEILANGSTITIKKDGTKHLVIPDSVTSIGDGAFHDNTTD